MTTNVTILTIDELPLVSGGVAPGPNGEGCTEPRQNDKSGSHVLQSMLEQLTVTSD